MEAGEDALGSAVRDIINVATSGQAVSSTVRGQPENKPSSSLLVHCGKTKIFMTHSMVSTTLNSTLWNVLLLVGFHDLGAEKPILVQYLNPPLFISIGLHFNF